LGIDEDSAEDLEDWRSPPNLATISSMAQLRFPLPAQAAALRYVRAPEPILFPEEEEVPEGYVHLVVRTFLFRLLSYALGSGHTVGSDQFIYWNAATSALRLAPDAFVRLGHPQPAKLGSWQTWVTGGAPDLAVEIVSPNEGDGVTWDEKLSRYHQLGVIELVRFDPEGPEGRRLRVWDRVQGDLVERALGGSERTPCLTLGVAWTVRMIPAPSGSAQYVGLRLVDDDNRLLETPEETEAGRAAAEAGRAAAEAARADAEAKARAEAEARIRQLEEQLRRAQGSGC
jgi:Uma2 family endonuclease